MPVSAVDVLGPAFQHAKRQLIQPFRFAQWTRLALVGLLAGEAGSGGGCNSGFQIPHFPQNTRPEHFMGTGLAETNPALLGTLIAVLIVAAFVLWIVLIYLNSMMRFVLFESVLAKECHIRRFWSRHQRAGFRYFVWQMLFVLAMMMALTILVGIPAAIAFAMGWLKAPGEHLAPLILGGILLFFVLFAFVVIAFVVMVLTKDFVVPQMALENVSAVEGWRRLWPKVKGEKGGYAGYLGMKIVTALGAAVVLGIVSTIVILVLLIPIGGFGAIAVLSGKAAGLTWNLYTISLAVVIGCIALAIILYIVALISVPAVVFFPAYSIYFFAARYPALSMVLYPPPPPIPPQAPTLPPLPPEPEPIG